MSLKLEFHTNYILNPRGMHFDPVKVSLVAFAIVMKIHSAHCVSNNLNRHLLAKNLICEEDTIATIDYEKLITLWTKFGKFMTIN